MIFMKAVNYIYSSVLFFSCFFVQAQDSILLKPKWQNHFSQTENPKYARLTLDQFDQKFKYGEYYDGLLVYRDSTIASKEVKIKFRGISDLCDMFSAIEYSAVNKWGEVAYNFAHQDKRALKMFVFTDITFLWQVVRKSNKVGGTLNHWSIMILNGPFFATRQLYTMKLETGKMLNVESDYIQKYEDPVIGRLDIFGAFNFKKNMGKVVADNEELASKVLNEEEGYKKTNVLKIFIEYNQWVKQQNPQRYEQSLKFPKIRY